MSLEKLGHRSLFGDKYKGQNSLFLAFCGFLFSGTTEFYQKDTFSVFLDKNKGQDPGTSLKCEK